MSDINRTSIALPAAVSNEIMAKTVEGSTIMQLARQVALPGRGLSIPVIVSDPVAEWVGETANKPVSNAVLSTKVLRPYKIAVIETVSKEFARDAAALYEE
ncbi:phage major capsid protein, partial [Staphylococcus epidermidis]|uniref:phage major capsid protein n=1 Tax=Staphylococcus epidermidis TaxID=1282 RepID=UPI003DA4C112